MFYSDDPARDAEDYYNYLDTKKAMWESRCATCEICGKAIDPNEDTHCLQSGDFYIHIDCMNKAIEKSNIESFLKDWLIEAVEETYYESTPIPEDI